MHNYQIADFNVKVMDPDELESAVELIRQEMMNRLPAMRDVEIFNDETSYNGDQIFLLAQRFEEEVKTLDLMRTHIPTEALVSSIDELAEKTPEYYEYPFVNGKNLLAAATKLQPYIFVNRDLIRFHKSLRSVHKFIQESFLKTENYFDRALEQFDNFANSKENVNLDFYKTTMNSYKASTLRTQGFYLIRSQAELDLRSEHTSKAFGSVLSAKEIQKNLLENATFQDENHAAMVLANYANSMKMSANSRNIETGLRYYKAARDVLGSVQEIEEGISFYEEIQYYNDLEKEIYSFLWKQKPSMN